MDRREFNKNILGAVSSYLFLNIASLSRSFGNDINPIISKWLIDLNTLCSDLKRQSISVLDWQKSVVELFDIIELKDILHTLDLNKLMKAMSLPDFGVNTQKIYLPKLEGLPEKTVFIKKIFGMKKGRAIIPHGHSNMASAHLILDGELHLRHFDKVDAEGNYLTIKPTIDRIAIAGESSTISDQKDNIHWFVANSKKAFTFDIIMLNLNGLKYEIQNIDIKEKVALGDGLFRVPKIDVKEGLNKYGKMIHH